MSRLIAALAFVLAAAGAAGQELSKGRIVERVPCSSSRQQSYTLYLPSNYDPAREWPVLYCLDPMARGRVPVERFQEAAERYGYIVAGSNNSRNGPVSAGSEAMQAFWQDTHERFRIHDRRAYVTGMSGGARFATDFMRSKSFAGVIAQAAGFSGTGVPAGFTYPFFGTAGTDDFNYPEMRRWDRELAERGVPHRVVFFDGPHDWAPKAICTEALGWMELEAMKAGTRPRDEALIEMLFQAEAERARAAETAGDVRGACSRYESLAADFADWKDTAQFRAKAAGLKQSKAYRDALQSDEKQEARQQQLSGQIGALMESLTDAAGRQDAFTELRSTIERLRAASAASADSGDRRVARRVLRQTAVEAWWQAGVWREKQKYAYAAMNLEVAAAVDPGQPEAWYQMAALYALAGDRGRAVSYLNKAVEKGFHDAARLEADSAFEPLRTRPEFQDIVRRLR